jgi:iron complex outermembrane receptor protein
MSEQSKSQNFHRSFGVRATLLLGSAASAMALGSPVHAQDEAKTATDDGEIVVTATKRAASVQDVPIAVSVIGGADLTEQHLADGISIARQTPNMTAESGVGPAMPRFRLRGVGSNEFVTTMQSPIGVYRDEVYIAAAAGLSEPVYDLDRVEVLRGPQGTLWGKNTTGGAIHYVTAKPSDTFKGRFYGAYGSDDTVELEGGVGGPIAPSLSFRLAGSYKARDGQIFNEFTGKKDGSYEIWDLRGHLKWEISAAASMLVTVHGGKSALDLPFFHTGLLETANGFVDANGYQENPDRNTLSNNWRHDTHAKRFGTDMRLDIDLGFADLVNLASYQFASSATYSDDDASPMASYGALLGGDSKSFLDELRLSSPNDGRAFSWIIGGFFLTDHTTALVRGPTYGVSNFGVGGFSTDFQINTKNYAGFANVNYEIDERLTVGAGIRYTSEKKSLVSGSAVDYNLNSNDLYDPSDVLFQYIDIARGLWLDSSGNPMTPPPSSRTWGRVTWDATVDYKVTNDIMLFGRVAKGFRSGNYNIYLAVPEDITTYEPETLMSYEAGIKSTFLDRRLKINVTGFHYDLSDLQVSALTDVVTGTKVVNAASARVDGVELEAVAAPVDGLSLSVGYGYQNARYHKFPNSSVPSAINGGAALDVSGAPLGSPKHTLNLGGSYEVVLGAGKLRFNTDWRYTSKQPGAPWLTKDYDELNHAPWLTEAAYEVIRATFDEKAYWLGNATLGYKFDERGPELSLWVKNITNNKQEGGFGMYFNRSLSSIPRGDRERTYGLGLSYSF